VEILTDTYKIRGTLFVPLAGEGAYSSRLSDFLNSPDKHFLALTNVTAEALPDQIMKWESPFLAVNKSAVTIVGRLKNDGIVMHQTVFSWVTHIACVAHEMLRTISGQP
jgi:hypothetical protein